MPSNGRRKSYSRRRRGTANRYAKKKRNFKRKYISTRKNRISSTSDVFPFSMYKVFTYNSDRMKFTQTSTDICPPAQQYRGNSCYDPDFSGIGSQPRWFDTLCGASAQSAPYQRYTVHASKIKITIWQDPVLGGATGSVAGIMAVYPFNGVPGFANQAGNLKELTERENTKLVHVGNANSSRPLTLKAFCKTRTIWNGAKPSADDDFSALYDQNPLNQWSWNIQGINVIPVIGGATSPGLFSCYYTVQIKYYTKLWTKNSVLSS